MALVSCPECNGQVSTSAPKCPHCGYAEQAKNPKSTRRSKVPLPNRAPTGWKSLRSTTQFMIVGGIVLGMIVAIGAFLPDSKFKAPEREEKASEKPDLKADEYEITGIVRRDSTGYVLDTENFGRLMMLLGTVKDDREATEVKMKMKALIGNRITVIGRTGGDFLYAGWRLK